MRLLNLVLTFCLSFFFAQTTQAFYVVGAFNPQWSYWQQSDLNYSLSRGQNFFVGKDFEWGRLELGFSEYSMQTGNSALSYSDSYQNLALVAAKDWANINLAADVNLRGFYLGGFGAARNTVTSRFQGSETSNSSDPRLVLQLGGGSELVFKLSDSSKFFLGLEGKIQRDSETKPQNFMTLQLRAGFLF